MGCGDVVDPLGFGDRLKEATVDPLEELAEGDIGGATESAIKGGANAFDPVYIAGEEIRKGVSGAMTPDAPDRGPDVIGQQEGFTEKEREELRRRKGLGSTRLAPPGLLTLSEENLKRPSLLGS